MAGTAALILGFYLVMFVFIELPLVGYLVAPARTRDWATRFNGWLDRNSHRLAIWALVLIWVYAIVRGLLQIV